MLVSSLNDSSVGGSIPGWEIASVTASRPTTRLSEPRLRLNFHPSLDLSERPGHSVAA